jgi:hypothetical protein
MKENGLPLSAARFFSFGALALAFFASPARADPAHGDLPTLNQCLLEHGYSQAAVLPTDDSREFIDVTVNGRKLRMLVDSGFFNTSLTRKTARALDLDVREVAKRDVGLGGVIKGDIGVATIRSFKLGDSELSRFDSIAVVPASAQVSDEQDGFFGCDYLTLNAVLLPLGTREFFYKIGPQPPASIAASLIQLGYRAVPLRLVPRTGLVVDGRLNDYPLHGLVDCGSPLSMFDLDFVCNTIGASATLLRNKMGGVDGRRLEAYRFQPRTIILGDFQAQSLSFAAVDAPAFFRNDINGLIGYDLLRKHRAIIDFGHDLLWLR